MREYKISKGRDLVMLLIELDDQYDVEELAHLLQHQYYKQGKLKFLKGNPITIGAIRNAFGNACDYAATLGLNVRAVRVGGHGKIMALKIEEATDQDLVEMENEFTKSQINARLLTRDERLDRSKEIGTTDRNVIRLDGHTLQLEIKLTE